MAFEAKDLTAILLSRPLDDEGELVVPHYSALWYATQLLKVLRVQSDTYRKKRFHHPARQYIKGLTKHVQDDVNYFFAGGLMQGRSEAEHRAALRPLFATIKAHLTDDTDAILMARAVAVALDEGPLREVQERQFDRYYSVLRPRDPGEMVEDDDLDEPDARVVLPGDPVPMCAEIFGKHGLGGPRLRRKGKSGQLATNPQNLPAWQNPDRLPSMLIAPELVKEFVLRLNFDYSRELQHIQGGSTRVATIHPIHSLKDDVGYEEEGEERLFKVYTRCGDDNRSTESKVAAPYPTRAEFRRRISDAVEAAAEQHANIIVLPELVLAESDVDFIHSTWRAIQSSKSADDEPFEGPQILIPGSWHEKRGADSYRNVTELWGTGSKRGLQNGDVRGVEVAKIVPYSQRIDDDTSRVERITTTGKPTVTLFCSDNATMMVMICVDFLLDKLRDLTRDLYASFVVVPTMSEKIRVFRDLMVGHVAATQAVGVVVNCVLPKDDVDGTVAFIQHPDRSHSIGVDTHTAPDIRTKPGLAVINLDSVVATVTEETEQTVTAAAPPEVDITDASPIGTGAKELPIDFSVAEEKPARGCSTLLWTAI